MARPRGKIFRHFVGHDNIGLLARRNTPDKPFTYVSVCDSPISEGVLGVDPNGREYVFPLYLYNENMGQMEKTANLNPEIVKKIAAAIAGTTGTDRTAGTKGTGTTEETGGASLEELMSRSSLSPEDIFHYIYAVLHTPEYRERYKEFLKVDFPRIPYPKNGDVFRKLADIGRQLVSVHLLKDAATGNMFDPRAQFPAAGTNRVEFLKYADGRVKINAEQHFDNVPETAWTFFIGGYQPAQKWLKDRKGRTLTSDDIMHYKAIVIALMETSRLMADLSALAGEWLPGQHS